ncbi:hypothetical protein IFM89_000748 [Coptis chinensis]|uniref:MATH domain-containing protein n=1 Tax=Coptis chinensis TaxID=261450 RepID=A0A835MDN5_9MAGN|nr:hypothetical protein IFM89_000748 [Coptis chinensis]
MIFITQGDYKWQIKLSPRGSGMTKDASISVYLTLDRSTPFPKGQKVYVDYKLRVRDQTQSGHTEKKSKILTYITT